MEQLLFILLCWTELVPTTLSYKRIYYLIQEPKTWSDARTYCRTNYYELASIDGADNLATFQTEAQKYQFTSEAWVGFFNDLNNWRWSLGNEPVTWTSWSPTQPNNAGGNQACGSIASDGWSDSNCPATAPFICFDERNFGTDQYIYYPKSTSWSKAQSYCRLYHTDLASTRNLTEYSNVVAKVAGSTWFGLFRTWRWLDRFNSSIVTWQPGQPDRFYGNEDCAFINNAQLSDALCSNLKPFFCENVPHIQQTLKIKLELDQDVNVSAVNAAILEKMQKKLKELGMVQNITMIWRKQPELSSTR